VFAEMSPSTSESLARRAAWSARLAWRAPLEARFPFRSSAAIERAQRRRLGATVAHAHEHVPYYRETMRRLGLGPGDIATAADIARLPLIERDQLQRDPEYFVSRAWPLERYLQLRSGGSTGAPVTIFRHPIDLFESAAYKERWRSIAVRLAGRRIRVRQALIALPGGEGGAAASFDSNTLLPSAVRVQRLRLSLLEPPAKLIGPLNEFRPDTIATYGSYLEALFTYVHRTGVEFHLPKTVGYSSDALSEAARRLITERFGIHVLSAYRAIEAPHIGFECERHTGYHLSADLAPVRIVDTDGSDLPVGEEGDVVVSNLHSGGTVLLNYRLGDRAARLGEGCDCGRSLPLLSLVRGRSDEWIVNAGGERVHGQGIRDLMRLRRDVLRYQVVQETPTFFRAAIVAPGADRDELGGWLRDRMRQWLGEATEVEVSLVDDLPRTAGGKTRPVVSLAAAAGSPVEESV
jgi:phenylacetate-CoA ligase